MRISILLIALTFLISCAGKDNSRLSPESDFYRYQVHDNTVLERFAYQPDVIADISRTPPSLRPSDYDFLTISTDLNADNKKKI